MGRWWERGWLMRVVGLVGGEMGRWWVLLGRGWEPVGI